MVRATSLESSARWCSPRADEGGRSSGSWRCRARNPAHSSRRSMSAPCSVMSCTSWGPTIERCGPGFEGTGTVPGPEGPTMRQGRPPESGVGTALRWYGWGSTQGPRIRNRRDDERLPEDDHPPRPRGAGTPAGPCGPRRRGRPRHHTRPVRVGVANYPQFYIPRQDVREDLLVCLLYTSPNPRDG